MLKFHTGHHHKGSKQEKCMSKFAENFAYIHIHSHMGKVKMAQIHRNVHVMSVMLIHT